jgi:aspartokinase
LLSKISKNDVLVVEKDLVVLYLLAPPEFWDVPGIIAYLTNQVSSRGVNIVDIVTTQTELSLILKKKDATKAFETINTLIEESKN